MSSYRTASSLFPGSHLPTLYIGMEFLRTNNLVQAQEFIRQAGVLCPSDPLVYNELGSVYYKQKEYSKAIEMFTKALKLCKGLPEVSRNEFVCVSAQLKVLDVDYLLAEAAHGSVGTDAIQSWILVPQTSVRFGLRLRLELKF